MLYFLCLVAIGMAVWNRGQMDRVRASIALLERELAILKRAPVVALATPAPAAFATPEIAPEPAVVAPDLSPVHAPEAPTPAAAPEEVFAVHDHPLVHSIPIWESTAETPPPAATPEEVFAVHDEPPAERHRPSRSQTATEGRPHDHRFRTPVWGPIARMIGASRSLSPASFWFFVHDRNCLFTDTVRVVLGRNVRALAHRSGPVGDAQRIPRQRQAYRPGVIGRGHCRSLRLALRGDDALSLAFTGRGLHRDGRGDRGRRRAVASAWRADRGSGPGGRLPDARDDGSNRTERAAAVRVSLLSACGLLCRDQEEVMVASRDPHGRSGLWLDLPVA